jgi:hypothetical protein
VKLCNRQNLTSQKQTLVLSGRLAPQSFPPRERAAARGIAFPALEAESTAEDAPPVQSLRAVLDKLSELALPTLGPHE